MGSVKRYSWAIGMIGTVTPAIRPISGANMPPALTTISAAMSDRSPAVFDGHAADPPALDRDPDHAGVRPDLRAARAGARGEREREP